MTSICPISFSLSFKLYLSKFNRDNSCQTLEHIFTSETPSDTASVNSSTKTSTKTFAGVLYFFFSTFIFSRSSPSDYDWDVPGHIGSQRIHFHHEVQDPSLNPARRARAEHGEHLLEDGKQRMKFVSSTISRLYRGEKEMRRCSHHVKLHEINFCCLLSLGHSRLNFRPAQA